MKLFNTINIKPFILMLQILYQNEIIDKEEKNDFLNLLKNIDEENKEVVVEKINKFRRRDVSFASYCETALKELEGERV